MVIPPGYSIYCDKNKTRRIKKLNGTILNENKNEKKDTQVEIIGIAVF